jgi:putative membrane protein (TIGR04086 family)
VDMSVRGTIRSLRRFPILYGVAWGLFVAVIGTLILSFWAHFGTLTDSHMAIAAYVVHCAAVIFGAVSGSRAASERGWYYGGVIGIVYALIMICIGIFVYNTFSMNAGGLFRVLLMALIGAFGGIIGVNTSND